MITKKMGGVITLVLLFSLIFLVDHSIITQSATNIGDFESFDSFTWNVEYNNTFDPSTNKKTTSHLILDSVTDDGHIWYRYNDTFGDFVSDWMTPNLTVQNLPLGTTDTIVTIPTLQEIIPNLCFMPIDWTENSHRFINGTYNLLNDIYYIENPSESTFTLNKRYRYSAVTRVVCIFEHNFTTDFAEDFTINYQRVTGQFRAVYNERLGFLISYHFLAHDTEQNDILYLSIELQESSQTLGWSNHFKRFVGFMSTGFPYFTSWIPILSTIFIKVQRKKTRELEILEGHRAVVAEKMKEKGLNEDDFCFIDVCPFCLEQLKKNKKKCPKCKGVR